MSDQWSYLHLADFLMIAEATLGVGTDDLLRVTQLHRVMEPHRGKSLVSARASWTRQRAR